MDRNRKCEQTERDGEREWKPQQKKIKREGGKEAERISIYFTEDVIKVAVVMLAVTTATEIVGSCAAVHAKNQQCDFVPGCQRMTDGDAQNQRKLTNYRLWSSDSTEMMIYLIFYSLINFIYTYKYVLILDLSTAACFKQGGTEAPGTSRKAHLFHLFVFFFFLFISRSLSNCKASFWHKLYQGVKCHDSSLASCYHPHLSTVVSCILIKFPRLIICIPTFFCFHLSFAQHPNFFSLNQGCNFKVFIYDIRVPTLNWSCNN